MGIRLAQSFGIARTYFTAEECDRIVALGERLEKMEAKVRYDPENNLRKSVVAWIPQDAESRWIYNKMTTCVMAANRQFWNWRVTKFESFQFTMYGESQHYHWHTDQYEQPYDEKSRWPGLTRKLSCVLQLSDPSEYEGGEFLLEDLQRPPDQVEKRIRRMANARQRGSVICFPAALYHRVLPVTRGLRRSLVGWYLGPPFV